MNPEVSIIVPNYNHAYFLEQRLQSIFNQTFQDFEVILLDDCSTDHSVEILKKYAKKNSVSHCVFNETNSGSTFVQWNKGISLAKGNYIWIAETDDFCDNYFLEKLLVPFKKDIEVELSYCQSHRVNEKNIITGNWITHTKDFNDGFFDDDFIIAGNMFIERYLIHKNVIPNVSAVLFKRQGLEKISPLVFKPFMKYNADWFYYIQVVSNAKLSFISESLNSFRYHKTSVIAKADGESGRMKILNMELKIRAFILKFLKRNKLKNICAVKEQYKKDNRIIHNEMNTIVLSKGHFLKAILNTFCHPYLFKKTSLYFYKKIRSAF